MKTNQGIFVTNAILYTSSDSVEKPVIPGRRYACTCECARVNANAGRYGSPINNRYNIMLFIVPHQEEPPPNVVL